MIRISVGRADGAARLLREQDFMKEIETLRGERCNPAELVVDWLDARGRVCLRAFCSTFEELEALADRTGHSSIVAPSE